MLDSFLEVAYAKESREEMEKNAVALLKQLPVEDLLKLTNGEKLASMGVLSDSNGVGSFLDKFHGSPLFEEALALEQEELQAEMTSLERRKENRVSQQAESGLWEMQDELRIKKRLLELRLAQEEAGAQAGGAVAAPLSAASMVPEAGAQGAGALGPEAAPVEAAKTAGVTDKLRGAGKAVKDRLGMAYTLHPRTTAAIGGGAIGAGLGAGAADPDDRSSGKHPARAGAVKGALSGGALGALVAHDHQLLRGVMNPATFEHARAKAIGLKKTKERASKFKDLGLRVIKGGKDLEKKSSSLSPFADAWGRELALADFSKAAEANALHESADAAGRLLAKEAIGLGPFGAMAANYVKNPKNLGTIVGAGTGAIGGLAHGLQKDNQGQRHILGGLAEGAAGGAVGGLAGHAAQNIGTSMKGGASFGDAAKNYGASMGGKIKDVYSSAMKPKARGAPEVGSVTPMLRRPSDPSSLAPPSVSAFAN